MPALYMEVYGVTVFLCLDLYDWQAVLFHMKREDYIQVEN